MEDWEIEYEYEEEDEGESESDTENQLNVEISLSVDFSKKEQCFNITHVESLSRMYKEQLVLFLDGVILLDDSNETFEVKIETPLQTYRIQFTRNDVVYATIADFANAKACSHVAFGTNSLFKAECLDDLENPLLARVKLINGIFVMEDIRVIIDDNDEI